MLAICIPIGSTILLAAIIISIILIVNHKDNTVLAGEIFSEYEDVNSQMLQLEQEYADSKGYLSESKVNSFLDDAVQQAEYFQSSGTIDGYKKKDMGIYMHLSAGANYFYEPTVKNIAAGDKLENIITIEPYSDNKDFVPENLEGISPDETASKIASELSENYSFDSDNNKDKLRLNQLRTIENKKVIIWYGHGCYTEETGSLLGSVETPDKQTIGEFSDYIVNGDIILGKNNLLISASYIDKAIKDDSLNGSVVYLAACDSMKDDKLGKAFINKGALAVVGNNGSVFTEYNLKMMNDFFIGLTHKNKDKEKTYFTAEQALSYAKQQNGYMDDSFLGVNGEVKLLSPENNNTEFRLVYPKGKEPKITTTEKKTESTKPDEYVVVVPTTKKVTEPTTHKETTVKPTKSYSGSNSGNNNSNSHSYSNSSSKYELSDWISKDIGNFLDEVEYMEVDYSSELGDTYDNGYLTVSTDESFSNIRYIEIYDDCDYKICGIEYGMDMLSARGCLVDKGYKFSLAAPDYVGYYKGSCEVNVHFDDYDNVTRVEIMSH